MVFESAVKPTMIAGDERDSIIVNLPGRAVSVRAANNADPDTIMLAQRLAVAHKIPGVTWVSEADAGD